METVNQTQATTALEAGILGALLLDPAQLPDLELEAEDFKNPAHRAIYRAVWSVHDNGHPVDLLTVGSELEARGELETIGGKAYLARLDLELPDPDRLPVYAEELRRHRHRRQLEALGRNLAEKATTGDPETLAGETRRKLELLEAPTAKQEARAVDLVPGWLETVAERRKRREETGEAALGLRVGLRALDRLLGGLEDSRLYLLAGPPGIGKTSLALQLALQVADREEVPAVYLSFENSAEDLGLKPLAALAEVSVGDIRRGFVELEPLEWAARHLEEPLGRLHLHEGDGRWTVAQLRAVCRRAMESTGAARCLVVVDYLQLWAKVAREWRDYSDVRGRVDALAGELLALARSLGSPVLALSSQNRAAGGYDGNGGRASLASLKESGDLEYSADVAMFLTEGEEQTSSHLRSLDLTVLKNRHGQTGKVRLTFRGASGEFRELVYTNGEPPPRGAPRPAPPFTGLRNR